MRIIDNQHGRVGRWVIERTGGVYTKLDTTAVGLEHGGKLIAGCIYHMYNINSICMHVAADGAFTKEFIWFSFYYPFEQLKVKKIIAMVESDNELALDIDRRLGFVHEHTIEGAGRKADMVLLSMTRDQCKWLNAVKRPGSFTDEWRQRNTKNAGLYGRS